MQKLYLQNIPDIMIEKSKNPISIRSRKMITNALMELLKEKPYEDITVTDIAERAQLVRKTFYRNFTGKDEIIECYFQDICKKFIYEFQKNQVCNYYEYALIVFRFWKPYGKMLIFLNKKNLFDYFQKAFDQIAPLASDFFPCDDIEETRFEYYCHLYVCGGFRQILCEWLLHGTTETPETMAEYFNRFRSGVF